MFVELERGMYRNRKVWGNILLPLILVSGGKSGKGGETR